MKIRTGLFLFLTLLVTMSFCYAADQSPKLTGIVDKINPEKKVITIRNEQTGAKQDLWFGEKTVFTAGETPATIQNVKVGSKVTIEVDEYNMITKVDLQSETAAPVQPEKPKPPNP